MKIIALKAENVKKLVAVEIRPDGHLVQITGKNGQGKTSVLDSIWWALAGSSPIQAVPIRKGATKAKIRLDLGEYVVTRTFNKGKHGETTTSIKVENAEGAKFSSPQTMLDGLLGALSFDPLAFSRMAPREQFDTVRKFAPGIDFDAIDALTKADYSKRTDLNRIFIDARAAAGAIEVDGEVPKELIDEMDLIDQLDKAGKQNTDIEQRKARREAAAKEIKDAKDQLDRIIEEAEAGTRQIKQEAEGKANRVLADAKAKRDELKTRADDLTKKLKAAPALPDPVDVSEIRDKITQAKGENDRFRLDEEKQRHSEKARKAKEESEKLTQAIEQREEQKRLAVAEAKLPVKDLSFGDGVVLLDGLPFDQASDARQLRASVEMAMSLNPKLRVIRVRDGSLLDEDSLKLMAEMAKEKDYQVWIEMVGSGKTGFVLEDGHVKAAVPA